MTEIVTGAVLVAVIAYIAGYLTGQYISRKRAAELKSLYTDAIKAATYVSSVLEDKRRRYE